MNTTSWFDVTIWGPAAEHNAKWLTKGSKISVSGELNQRDWTDRDGNNRSSVEIVAHRVGWLDIKPRAQDATA